MLCWIPVQIGSFLSHFGNINLHFFYYHHIYYCYNYNNNSNNSIQALSTWFLLASFTIFSIISLYLLLFSFSINFSVNNNILHYFKGSCKLFKMIWVITIKKLINLDGFGLLLLLLLPKLLVVSIKIMFFHLFYQWQYQL